MYINKHIYFLHNISRKTVVLYGCETWSLTKRDESQLRMFKNMCLGDTLSYEEEVTGGWTKLHTEELYDLCSLLTKYYKGDRTRRKRWWGKLHAYYRTELPMGLWWSNMNKRDHFEDLSINRQIMFKLIIKK